MSHMDGIQFIEFMNREKMWEPWRDSAYAVLDLIGLLEPPCPRGGPPDCYHGPGGHYFVPWDLAEETDTCRYCSYKRQPPLRAMFEAWHFEHTGIRFETAGSKIERVIRSNRGCLAVAGALSSSREP